MLIAAYGWNGVTMHVGGMPAGVLYGGILGIPCAIALYFVTSPTEFPRFYWIFAFIAFVSSVAWMNVQANEVVAVLETLGIVFGVETAILGLTVLAIGKIHYYEAVTILILYVVYILITVVISRYQGAWHSPSTDGVHVQLLRIAIAQRRSRTGDLSYSIHIAPVRSCFCL